MKRGFTLLEVMLALAIFALAAMAVLQIASGALSNQQILEEKTVAGWVAENQTALLYLILSLAVIGTKYLILKR